MSDSAEILRGLEQITTELEGLMAEARASANEEKIFDVQDAIDSYLRGYIEAWIKDTVEELRLDIEYWKTKITGGDTDGTAAS